MTNNEAIEILNTMLEDGRYLGNGTHIPLEVLETFNKAIEALKNQKTGHWIKHENPNLGQCMKISYECSYCKVWLGCEYFVRKSYCPNCGIKMEGEIK